MTDEEAKSHDEARSTVDVTIEPEQMLAARDELRHRLVSQYHMLTMLARASRKVGSHGRSRIHIEAAQRALLMIWALDNPMHDLAPEVHDDKPRPRGLSKLRQDVSQP